MDELIKNINKIKINKSDDDITEMLSKVSINDSDDNHNELMKFLNLQRISKNHLIQTRERYIKYLKEITFKEEELFLKKMLYFYIKNFDISTEENIKRFKILMKKIDKKLYNYINYIETE